MTVDIHPEDLIDKLTDGEISSAEAERLRAHLALCSSCRFELSVRGDFLAEMPAIAERPQLVLGASSEPLKAAHESNEELPRVTRAPRRRVRVSLLLVAAAFVTCAGGAAALNGAGVPVFPWLFRDTTQKLEHAPKSGQGSSASPKRAARTSALGANAPSSEDLPPAETAQGSAAAPEPTPAPVITAESAAPVTPQTKPVLPPSAPALANAVSATPTPTVASPTSIDFAAAIGTPAPSAGSLVAEAEAAPDDAASLFSQANRARRDGNSERAELLYRSLQARFPSSPESELSREVLAQMLLERGNAAGALAGFERYLANGSSGLAAEALVGRARALEQLGQRGQAAAAWREVARRYPGTVHARLAEARLATLDPE